MPRILVINNYPLENVWEEVKRKEKPDHHLYGINYFHSRGYEVKIVPYVHNLFLRKIDTCFQKHKGIIPFGSLDRQWQALKESSHTDLIYAPCQTETQLLSYLSALGLIQVPIVCLAHHPLNRGRLASIRHSWVKLSVRGYYAYPSLSSGIAQTINQLSGYQQKSILTRWGPDQGYYPGQVILGKGVVAAGRTGRDFDTFGLAASQTNSEATIVCLENSVSQTFKQFGNNLRVMIQPIDGFMKYPDLMAIYQKARALAIPMISGTSLAGLTSLMDSLAMGKPTIMTRHPLIDIDIEAEGIGIWVEPGDIQGWRKAIQFFEDNPQQAIEMGKRARKLVDSGLNSFNFANQIMDIFDRLLQRDFEKDIHCNGDLLSQ
jgi:glycosyltransferase involved in cell wall biosynthesis